VPELARIKALRERKNANKVVKWEPIRYTSPLHPADFAIFIRFAISGLFGQNPRGEPANLGLNGVSDPISCGVVPWLRSRKSSV
jgi:hypothetical protein